MWDDTVTSSIGPISNGGPKAIKLSPFIMPASSFFSLPLFFAAIMLTFALPAPLSLPVANAAAAAITAVAYFRT